MCDNCPYDANPVEADGRQKDDDHDGVGDVCDHCLKTRRGKSVFHGKNSPRNGCSEGDPEDNPPATETEKQREKRKRKGLE